MTFRKATLDDREAISLLVVDLYSKIVPIFGIPMKAESLIRTITHIIKNGVCVIGDRAVAGGYVEPWWWNGDARIGYILFWNFETPKGIKVFEAMIEELKKHGATHILTASHFPANRIGEHYLKQGFHPTEIQYIVPL